MASPSRLKSPNVARVSRVMSPAVNSSPESHCPTPSINESHKVSNPSFSKSGLLAVPTSDFGAISNLDATSSQFAPSSLVLHNEIEEVNVKSPSAWIQSTGGT